MARRIIMLVSLGLALVGCGGETGNSGSANSSASSSSSTSSSSSSSSSSTSSSSSGSMPTTLTLQENQAGVCRVDGDPNESKNTGFTGTGYANVDNLQGSSIVWAINATDSDRYRLTLRFANGGIVPRNGALLINSGSNGNHVIELPPTGAWTTWQDVVLEVDLTQGNNILQLASSTIDGLANIDFLSITGAHLSAGDCGSVSSSSSSSSSSSASSASSSSGSGMVLPQSGNPVQSRYNSAKSAWGKDKADIILSHQFTNGGWPKNQEYDAAGSGGNGAGVSTFDNGATTTETIYLAQLYSSDRQTKYRDAVRKAVDFTLSAQYPSGGWPQFYPLKGGYSDHVTFNDNAMTRVLTLLHNIAQRAAPFDTDVVTDAQRTKAAAAVTKGVDYILRSQWRQNGVLTVWCAQHGATDYQPKAARAYELESLSGSESVEIIAFLMTQPQTPQIASAVKAGLVWFRSPNTYLADHAYVSSVEEKIVPRAGSKMWYRFYKLDTNRGFFSDRDGGTYYDIMQISEERRNGYSWGGDYGNKIISYAEKVGY